MGLTTGFVANVGTNKVVESLRKVDVAVAEGNIEKIKDPVLDMTKVKIPIRYAGNVYILVCYLNQQMAAYKHLLPPVGRKLKTAKTFTWFALESNYETASILTTLVGALGGGYVLFNDTGLAPAVEIGTNGRIVQYNPNVSKIPRFNMMRNILYDTPNAPKYNKLPPHAIIRLAEDSKYSRLVIEATVREDSGCIIVLAKDIDSEAFYLAQVTDQNKQMFDSLVKISKRDNKYITLDKLVY